VDESLERHAPNAASPLKSHTRHEGHQAGNGSRQTNPTSLTVPRALVRRLGVCDLDRHNLSRVIPNREFAAGEANDQMLR
jgi:hypothetical protein